MSMFYFDGNDLPFYNGIVDYWIEEAAAFYFSHLSYLTVLLMPHAAASAKKNLKKHYPDYIMNFLNV